MHRAAVHWLPERASLDTSFLKFFEDSSRTHSELFFLHQNGIQPKNTFRPRRFGHHRNTRPLQTCFIAGSDRKLVRNVLWQHLNLGASEGSLNVGQPVVVADLSERKLYLVVLCLSCEIFRPR